MNIGALKIQIPYGILLAALWLMLGDYAQAGGLPVVQPSSSEALPRVDPQRYWFSNRRSWLAIFPNDASTLRLYYSYLSGGWDNAQWVNIRFLRDGKAVDNLCSASPVAFEVQDKSTAQDGARLILSGERDALIAASGLGIQLSPVQKDYNFEKLVRDDE